MNRLQFWGCTAGILLLLAASQVMNADPRVESAVVDVDAGPRLDIRPMGSFALEISLLPYREACQLRLPEGIGAVTPGPDIRRIFHHACTADKSYAAATDGWWTASADVAECIYVARAKVNPGGGRIDVELRARNKTEFGPCLGPPDSFKDPRMERTFVVASDGKLKALGDLTGHYDVNICTLADAPPYLRHPVLKPRWRTQNLRLREPAIIIQAKDGRYTLITAYERAWAVSTGFVGSCIHSCGMTPRVAPGGEGSVRGFIALVPGKASDALKYYYDWKNELRRNGRD